MLYVLNNIFALVNWNFLNLSMSIFSLSVTDSIGVLYFLHTSHTFPPFMLYCIYLSYVTRHSETILFTLPVHLTYPLVDKWVL